MNALFPCPYCGHSITKQDAAGFRIIGPDEVDQVTVEKCAEVAREQMNVHQGPFGSQSAYVASHAITAAIRAIKGNE